MAMLELNTEDVYARRYRASMPANSSTKLTNNTPTYVDAEVRATSSATYMHSLTSSPNIDVVLLANNLQILSLCPILGYGKTPNMPRLLQRTYKPCVLSLHPPSAGPSPPRCTQVCPSDIPPPVAPLGPLRQTRERVPNIAPECSTYFGTLEIYIPSTSQGSRIADWKIHEAWIFHLDPNAPGEGVDVRPWTRKQSRREHTRTIPASTQRSTALPRPTQWSSPLTFFLVLYASTRQVSGA
ncbi:hypothetical protein C8Q78DRAFT_1060996 [Trametes maxima]|nr:hypothetical protein C8Q78DRAFT_1060996 [Trametes maxima]